MDTHLHEASHQWASRPADERFWTLEEMYQATLNSANNGVTVNAVLDQLRAVNNDGDVQLETSVGNLKFNNWTFNQFANRVGAPGSYLATLPAELAATALNVGIKREASTNIQLWYDSVTHTTRAITSQSYNRIFNHEVIKALIDLPGNWVTPPARPAMVNQIGTRIATEADCVSSTLIKPGDLIAPAGLYASDRDMFAFLVDPETRINDGTDEGLSRGFFVRNSEVGNSVFEIVTFLYRYVCGNHIVWGATKVNRLAVKHMGNNARKRAFDKIADGLKAYQESSAGDETQLVNAARNTELADSFDNLSDFVFAKKWLGRKEIKEAYDIANQYADVDGSPRSIWGFSSGITRLSQQSMYADKRNMLDRAAGNILALVQN